MLASLPDLPPEQLVLFFALLAIPILPNLWSIWHAFRHEFSSSTEKMFWIWLAVLVPMLGGVIYIIAGRPRGRKIQF